MTLADALKMVVQNDHTVTAEAVTIFKASALAGDDAGKFIVVNEALVDDAIFEDVDRAVAHYIKEVSNWLAGSANDGRDSTDPAREDRHHI